MKAIAEYVKHVRPSTANLLAERLWDLLVLKQQFLNPDLTEAGVCEQLKISRPVLAATMQLRFNSTFKGTINKMRVERAMVMLKDATNAELSCEEIAYSVGFRTRQTFYNAFHRHAGTTPQVYRMNYK